MHLREKALDGKFQTQTILRGQSAQNLTGVRSKSTSSKASKRYAEAYTLQQNLNNNGEPQPQNGETEEVCSATLSDYFDVTRGEANEKKQSRVYVKEAFCEEQLKLDVA